MATSLLTNRPSFIAMNNNNNDNTKNNNASSSYPSSQSMPRRSSDRGRGIGGVPYAEQSGGGSWSLGDRPSMGYGDDTYGRVNQRVGGPSDRSSGRAGEEGGQQQDYNHDDPNLGSSLPNPYAQPAMPRGGQTHRDRSPSSISGRSRYPLSAALPSASATSSTFANPGQVAYEPANTRMFDQSRSSGSGYTTVQPTRTNSNRQPGSHDQTQHNSTMPYPNPNPNLGMDKTTDRTDYSAGRVTLPILHLGSFSSLKLEDFAIPPSSATPGSPGRPSPLGYQSDFAGGGNDDGNGQDSWGVNVGRRSMDVGSGGGGGRETGVGRDEDGDGSIKLRPTVMTQDVYRSGSPSQARARASPTEMIGYSQRQVGEAGRSLSPSSAQSGNINGNGNGKGNGNGIDNLSPISASFDARRPAFKDPRPSMEKRQDSGDAMTPGMAGVGSNGMFSDRLGEEQQVGRRDSRGMNLGGGGGSGEQEAYVMKEGRPGSRASVGTGAARRVSGQSSKRDPSPLGRSRHTNAQFEPRTQEVDVTEHVNTNGDGDRDDHRQAVIRESTVNRRRTIIQEPTRMMGDSPDSKRGQSFYDIQQKEGSRSVPSGIRSRQASGNMLEFGGDGQRNERSPTRATYGDDFGRASDGPPRPSAILQPAFEPQPSQLPYQRLDAAMPSSDSRFKDAEATPTKRRALPTLPDLALPRSTQASPSRDNQRERDRRIPSSSSWQQQNAQPSRTATCNSSSRKVSPMGAVNLPQRASSYAEPQSPRLEAIPGLMGEDGPYPSIARPQARAKPTVPNVLDRTSQYQEISVGRRPSAEVGKPLSGVPPRVKVPPQAEEICLECLMRDRDLIHVDVTTEGVWERASDMDFRDMLDQERDLERQDQSYTAEEMDTEIIDTVGWRGFVWEEGEGGWGLPAGFRGRLAGKLLEGRLKDVLSQFPPAASFRMQTLQKYLQDQAALYGQAPPEFVPDEEYARLPTGQGTMGPRPKPHSPPRTQQTRDRVEGTRSGQAEREIRGQVPRPAALTMYGAPETGHESPYPEEELKRYQSQPDMLALQAYPGPNQRREMALRAEQGARAVTMYVQSPGSGAAPSRQPAQQEYMQASSGLTPAAQLETRKGRGISSPGMMQDPPQGGSLYDRQSAASAYANQHRQEFERGDYQNDVPSKQFPFAVWAGRNGEIGGYSAQSSPGPRTDHSVNSHARPGGGMLGRFGGSVTSFFGGSQGGVSGSMMDMHLGLENDRAYPRSPDHQTRSVSMASPAKPRFFARPSRESLPGNSARPTLLNRIRSSSSVMELASLNRSSIHDNDGEFDDSAMDEGKKKKKGIKGFLQKLGGKGNKRKSSGSDVTGGQTRATTAREEDATLPLRPPPSLSFLVDSRVDRPVSAQHGRSPSGSSLSGMAAAANPLATNNGTSPEDASPPLENRSTWTPQQRSVSAPGIVNSTSRTSLLSSSPTSSRYPYGQEGRGGQPAGYAPAPGQRDSISSTFSGRRRASGVPVHGIDEERVHDSAVEVLEHENPRGWTEQPGPPPLQRHHREKAPSSNSSGTILPTSLESPGPVGNAAYGHQVAVAGSGSSYSLSNQAGPPDRQKNLPPLPPGMRRDRPSPDGSPNSFDAFFGQPERYTTAPNMHQAPGGGYHGRQASAGQQSYHSAGQQSFQSSVQSSASFTRNQGQPQVQSGPDATSDRQAKRTKSRFGLKGLFAGGLNLNKDDKPMINDRQYDRSPSLDAGSWMDSVGSRDDQPQRRVGGHAGNERYRQTYYQ